MSASPVFGGAGTVVPVPGAATDTGSVEVDDQAKPLE